MRRRKPVGVARYHDAVLRSASLRLRIILIAAAFGLVAAACGGGTETAAVEAPAASEPDSGSDAEAAVEEDADTAAETPATDPGLFGGEFVDLNGESIDLASLEGQDAVLWFWAPW